MKNCPNCGSPIDPYRVKCEYCDTMYFDLATWLHDGKPCFINYSFDAAYGKGTITTQAIPHLETVEMHDDPTYITNSKGDVIHSIRNNRSCELHVNFECVENPDNRTMFTVTMQ